MRWLQVTSPCMFSNCLMNEHVVSAVCVGVGLCGSHLHKWLIQSNRVAAVSPSSRNPKERHVSFCLSACTCPAITPFKSGRIILLQKRLMCHPLLATSLSFKSYARTKVEDTAVCESVLRVGGGCVKEEVLSGTEAFCRCWREGGLNGNFCGYQPRGSSLWLEKVCHVWPHPKLGAAVSH